MESSYLDDRTADRLDMYWDRIVHGISVVDEDLDASLAAVLDRLGALDDVPSPDPSFVEQLRRLLLAPTPSSRPEPRLSLQRRARQYRPGWLAVVIAAGLTLVISAGAALAVGLPPGPIRIEIVPTDHIQLEFSSPNSGMSMSLDDAERAAGYHLLRSVTDPDAQLVGVTYFAPTTRIDGRPVINPSGRVRLAYRLGNVTVTVDESRDPAPGRPLQVIHLGAANPHESIETRGGGDYLVARTPDDRRVERVTFAIQSTAAVVAFAPPFVNWTTASDFISHLQ